MVIWAAAFFDRPRTTSHLTWQKDSPKICENYWIKRAQRARWSDLSSVDWSQETIGFCGLWMDGFSNEIGPLALWTLSKFKTRWHTAHFKLLVLSFGCWSQIWIKHLFFQSLSHMSEVFSEQVHPPNLGTSLWFLQTFHVDPTSDPFRSQTRVTFENRELDSQQHLQPWLDPSTMEALGRVGSSGQVLNFGGPQSGFRELHGGLIYWEKQWIIEISCNIININFNAQQRNTMKYQHPARHRLISLVPKSSHAISIGSSMIAGTSWIMLTDVVGTSVTRCCNGQTHTHTHLHIQTCVCILCIRVCLYIYIYISVCTPPYIKYSSRTRTHVYTPTCKHF